MIKNNDQNGHNKKWSGKRGSNPRPSPWQGDALSTELLPHQVFLEAIIILQQILEEVNDFLKKI